MTQAQLVNILNISAPLISGAILAAVGLANKYRTAKKYVFTSLSAWIYILLSSGGAYVVSLFMQAIGTRVIQIDYVNSLLLGVLASGVFLGIISSVSVSRTIDSQTGEQLRTIRDYIFKFLEDSIAKRIMQIVESEIQVIGKVMDTDILLKEATTLIGGPKEITADKKEILIIQFDEYASQGDYASIIRELIKYYDISFIIKHLSQSTSTVLEQGKGVPNTQGQVLSSSRRLPHPELPEYSAALMCALQKEPECALYYLKQVLEKVPTIGKEIVSKEYEWRVFTSMTHGESELAKLDELMSLIGTKRPTFEELKTHCNNHHNMQHAAFMAIKKANGNCVRIIIRCSKLGQDHSTEWQLLGDWGLEKDVASLDGALDLVRDFVIPTRLILSSSIETHSS